MEAVGLALVHPTTTQHKQWALLVASLRLLLVLAVAHLRDLGRHPIQATATPVATLIPVTTVEVVAPAVEVQEAARPQAQALNSSLVPANLMRIVRLAAVDLTVGNVRVQ
jgi:hypothetical protein